MSDIAILGLGIIGSGVAGRLASLGLDVTVWNRTPKSGYPHASATPAEAATQSRVISLYLKDRQACQEVFDAMAPALTPEHIILNHSTIDLETVKALDDRCKTIGCAYLDCPFTGSKIPAVNGTLAYYVSGEEYVLERVRPLLEKSSKAIIYTGAMGNGTILKLVTNLLSATMVQGLSEALAITKAHGMNAQSLLDAIGQNVVTSPLASFKVPYMDKKDFSTHFSLDNMRKDSTYALELAREQGIDPPQTSLVSAIMTRLCTEGHADKDFCVLSSQFDQ